MDRVTTIPVPQVNRQRYKFDLSSNVFTTFNAGEWVPIGEPIEVLPGDTFDLNMLSITRMETFIKAPMDNLDMDIVAFYCRNKDAWEHFEEFFGENKTDEWTEGMTEYEIPQLTAPTAVWGYKEWQVDSTTIGTFYTRSGTAPNFTYTAVTLPAAYDAGTTYYKQLTGWDDSSIANYFGVPIGESGFKINHLPFRHYAMICNEWLRNQNAMKSAYINKGDADTAGSNGSNYQTDVIGGGRCFPAVKKPDFYTKALPEPQKGQAATLPLGISAPVIAGEIHNFSSGTGMRFETLDGSDYTGTVALKTYLDGGAGMLIGENSSLGSNYRYIVPTNLNADLTHASAAKIEDLRKTIAIQRYMERDSLYGTRYREFLFGHFNIDVGAGDMHIPEYLGGKTIPIHINAITQTSESNITPQGNIAGMSVTQDSSSLGGLKTCLEHGYIIILGCVRIKQHTYQQGLRKFWSRKSKYDFYDPLFAGFGNQPIYNKEIFLQNDNVVSNGTPVNDQAFAYQEYGADYRFSPNIVTGEMRDLSPRTQSLWHFADMYYSLPKYGSEWIVEDKSNIDNTLSVPSERAHQFKALFKREVYAVRTVTGYSVPGMGMAI